MEHSMHPSSFVDEGVTIGKGKRIRHFCHVLRGSRIGETCVLGQNVMVGPDVEVGDGCKIHSWKGEKEKAGGLSTNIGIHFFDMLLWIFGAHRATEVHLSESKRESGVLELERARVRWFLSIDRGDLPGGAASGPRATFRSVTVDGQEVEFFEGFSDLHTESYREILAGNGFGIGAARPAVELVHAIRSARVDIPHGFNNPSKE
jgi:predicted dehydrogenase